MFLLLFFIEKLNDSSFALHDLESTYFYQNS